MHHQNHHGPQRHPQQQDEERENRHQDGQTSHLENAQPINPVQQSTDSYHRVPMPSDPSNYNEVNPLTLLAHALEPYAVRGASPRVSTSEPPADRLTEPLYSVPSGASGSSNRTRQLVDDGQQGGSYGTLMLSTRGRSKYLGPTAGSEWLKEVSHPFCERHK